VQEKHHQDQDAQDQKRRQDRVAQESEGHRDRVPQEEHRDAEEREGFARDRDKRPETKAAAAVRRFGGPHAKPDRFLEVEAKNQGAQIFVGEGNSTSIQKNLEQRVQRTGASDLWKRSVGSRI